MADGTQLGQAYVPVVPKLAPGAGNNIQQGLNKGMPAAGKAAGNSFGGSLVAGIKKHAGAIAGVISAAAMVKFSKDSVTAFTDLAGSTKKLQRVMGGTAKSVSGISGAMKLSGMDTSKASTSLTIFSKKIQAAAGDADKMKAVSKDLGVAVYDSHGKVKSMGDLLPQIADKFAGMEDGAAKTALACQYFGKSGTDMLPFLNKGSKGIEELKGKAKELGIVLDDSAMDKFGAYKGALREWDTAIQGAQVTLGQSLAPMITSASTMMTTVLVPAVQGATQWFSQFVDGINSTLDVEGITGAITGIGDAFMSAFPSDGGSPATFGEAVGSAMNGVKGALEAVQPFAQVAGEAFKFVADNANWLVPAALGVFGAFKLIQGISGVSTMLSGIGTALGITAGTAPAAAGGMSAMAGAESAAGAAGGAAASSLMRVGVAVLAIGGGVALACAGIAMLAQSAIALSNSGGMAVPILIGMGAGLIVLAGAFAILGPGLNIAVPGMLAFGAAVLMAGAGAALLGAGVMMAGVGITLIASSGAAAAAALGALVPSMLMAAPALGVFSATAAAASAGVLAFAGACIGALGGVAGLLALMAATGAAAVVMGTGLVMGAAGLSVIGASGAMAASVLPIIAASAAEAAPGILAFGAACMGAMAGVGMLVPLMAGLSASSAVLSATVVMSAAGMGVLAASIGVMGPAAGVASAAFASLQGSLNSLAGGIGAIAPRMQSAASAFTSAVANMGSRSASVLASIRAQFANMRLSIPSPSLGKMPHFYINGNFDLKARKVPTIGVNWYAKGGVFTQPSIVGVGEAGDEAVLPLNSRVLGRIADGISKSGASKGDMVVNFTINGADDPEKVVSVAARKLRMMKRQGAI